MSTDPGVADSSLGESPSPGLQRLLAVSHMVEQHQYSASLIQFSSAAQSCPILWDPMDCSTPGFPVLHYWLKVMSIESLMPSNHLILHCPLLLPPSIFPSIRVFSNESVLLIRWPKDWIFGLKISSGCQNISVTASASVLQMNI